jgi:hypothetical protein
MVYASPSSSSTQSQSLSPPDMSSQAFNDEWNAVSNSVKSAPADQREQLEDQQFLSEYNSGEISANDLNKLLTKAEASNPQVDPGKQAVQNAEAWAKANGVTLTDQQKDSIAKSARQQAAQQKLSMVQNLLASEYRNQPLGAHQAVAIGFSVFDQNGNKTNVLARIDAQGNFDQLQKISDLGNGYGDQVLIDNAVDQLRSQQATDPGKAVSQQVHGPGGTFNVSLDANGNATIKQVQHHSFWGSLVGFVENVVAPVALAMIPGVGVALAAAYEGVKGGYDIANGNTLGGLAEIFGGVAGVGGIVGGTVGDAVQEGAQLANVGVNVDAAVQSGNVLGAISAAAGATGPLGNLSSTLGDDGLASAISDWAPDAVTAAKFGADIASGNYADAIGLGANLAPDVADQLGASDGLVDAVGSFASDAASAAKIGQSFANGNYFGAAGLGLNLGSQIADQLDAPDSVSNWLQDGSNEVAEAAKVASAAASGNYAQAVSLASNTATDFSDLLGSAGGAFGNVIDQITPYATAGVQLGQGIEGVVKAASQANGLSGISSGLQQAFELPALVQQIRDELGGYGNDGASL